MLDIFKINLNAGRSWFGGALYRSASRLWVVQALDQMLEFLALNGDMTPDGMGRAIRITGNERVHDRLMLRHGFLHPPAQAQLHPAKGLQPAVQPQGFLL